MIRGGGESSRRFDDLLGRRGNKHDVGAGDRLLGLVGENALEVWKLGFDVLAVGADEGRGVDDRVVNADLVALAEQSLGQVDVGALSEVVAAGFEAQAQEGNPIAFSGDDSVDGLVDRQPVARQCPREQRNVDALAPRQVEEGSEVLGEA